MRRFAAAGFNFIVFGLLVQLSSFLAGQIAAPDHQKTTGRLMLLGLLTLYWLACIMSRKSVGGAICLLELRRDDFRPIGRQLFLLRSLPFYLVGVIVSSPWSLESHASNLVRGILVLLSLGWFLTDIIALVITGRSLLDRVSGTKVLWLNLPEHLRPKAFGRRIVP